MRVAVCYRGHYQRRVLRQTKGSDPYWHEIDFFENYQNHIDYLFKYLDDYDIFFHTYESTGKNENKLIKLLKPKKFKIEKANFKKINYSIFEVNKLYDESDYDCVINLRFDLIFVKDLKQFHIDYKKFNFLFKDHVRPWERDKKTSDMMYVFNSKYKKNFQESINDKNIKIDKVGSAHFIYKGLTRNGRLTEEDINFMVGGHHTSWVQTDESKNGFVSLNRGYKVQVSTQVSASKDIQVPTTPTSSSYE